MITTIQYGIPVSGELLDEVQVRACNRYSGLELPESPLLLLEFHGTEAGVAEQAELFTSIAGDFTDAEFVWTTDAAGTKSCGRRGMMLFCNHEPDAGRFWCVNRCMCADITIG